MHGALFGEGESCFDKEMGKNEEESTVSAQHISLNIGVRVKGLN